MITPFDLDNKDDQEENEAWYEIETLAEGLSSTDDDWD